MKTTINDHKPERRLPISVASYLKKRSVLGPWTIAGNPGKLFNAAIVIPALSEFADLPSTLQTLSRNTLEYLTRTMILIVVNHRIDAADAERDNNIATLAALPEWRRKYGLENLNWIDASSQNNELPLKQGVGLARKIGMDIALSWLDFGETDPILISLDADTLTETNYLEAIYRHFNSGATGGATIPFRHHQSENSAGQLAIDRYELFLRAYALGMELAGSPYAFHTVGSAMACRVSAYVAAGGMNKRMAGEDFYFLQQIHKTAGVSPLKGTVVHPSPRSSHRVPFGTGRAVGDMLSKGKELLFYQPCLFEILRQWLECIAAHYGSDGDFLARQAGNISPHLESYLRQIGFAPVWDKLLRNNPDERRLMTSFHAWFDAFRTMRLIRCLTDNAYPRIPAEQAVPPLLKRTGCHSSGNVSELIACLRKLQGV